MRSGEQIILRPQITRGVVFVWRVPLSRRAAELQSLVQTLSPDEKQRAANFHFGVHRDRFVACRAAVRQLLALCLGIRPHEVTFSYNAFGKPEPTAETSNGLRFNVSHSDDEALVAITRADAVGVDIERIRVLENLESLAQASFSRGEFEALQKLPPESKNRAFFQTWTRKEAFLKACGTGFSLAPSKFDVSIEPDEPPRLLALPAGVPVHWTIADLAAVGGFVASVAVATANAEVQLQTSLRQFVP